MGLEAGWVEDLECIEEAFERLRATLGDDRAAAVVAFASVTGAYGVPLRHDDDSEKWHELVAAQTLGEIVARARRFRMLAAKVGWRQAERIDWWEFRKRRGL